MNPMPFVALTDKRFEQIRLTGRKHPIIAVDLGYAKKRNRSCGLWIEGAPISCVFADAVALVAEALNNPGRILAVEAPLSTRHDEWGNPSNRGQFENGRGWYHQPAACVTLGAMRFLGEVAKSLKPSERGVLLAEACLTRKPHRTDHAKDAWRIAQDFWRAHPAHLDYPVEAVRPDLIDGIPCVLEFKYK